MKFNKEKTSKYHNKKVVIDGIKFDSKREGDRYLVLKNAESQGIISDLKLQVKFELIPAIRENVIKKLKTKEKVEEKTIQLAINYTADFTYLKDGVFVVEDCKISKYMIPKEYVIKEKIFRWKYGFPIKRVYKPTDYI